MIDERSYLAELFDVAFGVKSPVFMPYPINLEKLIFKEVDNRYPDVLVKSEKQAEALSWMGTPIVYAFKLIGKVYKTYNLTGQLEDYPLEDFTMPSATLVEFTRAKNIIKTSVLGNEGTVKELFGYDDWKVRIRGVCLNEPGRSADFQKAKLLEWERVCGSVEVSGKLFSEKFITNLTINSITFQQLEKQPDVLPFEMDCDSDQDLRLAQL